MPESLYLSGCQKDLPAWGVTRQYDFGQFVLLYQVEQIDGQDVSVPLVVAPDGTLNAVGTEEELPTGTSSAVRSMRVAGRARSARTLIARADAVNARAATAPESSPVIRALGGVPLDLALSKGNPIELLAGKARRVLLDDLAPVLRDEPLTVGRTEFVVDLDSAAKEALLSGTPVSAVATSLPAGGARTSQRSVVLRLVPQIVDVPLEATAIDQALATGTVDLGEQGAVGYDRGYIDWAIRTGRPARLTAELTDGSVRILRLRPELLPTSKPAARRFVVEDPARFLARPVIPGVDGSLLDVSLSASDVESLRTERRATVEVNGSPVELLLDRPQGQHARSAGMRRLASRSGGVTPAGMPLLGRELDLPEARPARPRGPGSGGFDDDIGLTPYPDDDGFPGGGWPGVEPEDIIVLDTDWLMMMELLERMREQQMGLGVGGGGGGSGGGSGGSGPGTGTTPGIPSRSRERGLALAVFLPWRQQWVFRGCSRGSLLSSIALAPDESRTIRVYSWERRAKALEQSSETETEMLQDFTSTTRDSQDVLREMTTTQDFSAEAHGQVDASYSNGVASVAVGVGGSLDSQSGLEQICRSTTTHMQETVRRASARVAARRITRITESEETIRGDEVLRHIRNPNRCHTLTLDYYEQLAHYVVTTKFLRDRVKLVVMVENPLQNTKFDNLVVRTNETALRNALLNPELGDAFAACRLLASYGHAWTEAETVAAKAKQVAEMDREREKPAPTAPEQKQKPANPHTAKLLAVLKEIRSTAGPVISADIGPALDEIGAHQRPVEPVNRQAGRQWLFRRLVEARIGVSFTTKLAALVAKTSELTVDDARSFADGIPANSYPTLRDLGSLKDNEKEDAALAAVFKERMAMPWDWAWWSGSAREEGLYEPDDNGLAGACERLVTALREYETKASEGDALLSQQEMVNKANEEQAAANWVDKLEMKYGLDTVADARERQEALLAHLDAHADYYRYVLFQALPPGEQLARLTATAPQLKVGYFEPRVVSYSGNMLAVPLTPLGQSDLANLVDNLSEVLETAAEEAAEAALGVADDDIILPTPGLTVETSLGRCSACGPHEERLQNLEARRLEAAAALEESEVERRQRRLEEGQLDSPSSQADPLRLQVDIRSEHD